jgi:diguanylate cyclase
MGTCSAKIMIMFLNRISNLLLSVLAGVLTFAFTMFAFLRLKEVDEQLAAAFFIGLFALVLVWIAGERPNSAHSRAVHSLIDRLLAVKRGDLSSPAPKAVRDEMPELASAVDSLFEQVRANLDDVHAMALYDAVSKLPNRVFFKREAERILKAQKAECTVALIFIDLDGFKEVNDRYGHAMGDQVLQMVANRLRIVMKAESDCEGPAEPLIARLAGDEFTLLFPSVRNGVEAERIGRRALAALMEPFRNGGQCIDIAASVGVALSPDDAADLTSLMKAADIAMYHAKATGRAQVCVYDGRLAAAFAERTQTERALRKALGKGEFKLVYQPQISARTGEVVAGEALLRWHHPVDGLKLPHSFIDVAEDSSLILDIGEWVMEEVAQALGRWKEAGRSQRIAFNLSPRQLEQPEFFKRLTETMTSYSLPPWLLELEFTETMVMRCDGNIIRNLNALREQGVTITIDDFGAGYSNLARMKDMPVDRVKLDKGLVQEIDSSDSARTIVSAVIHLIHGLGLEVIAEGVERQSQIDVLNVIGCDIFQGYAFSEPAAEEEFFQWLEQHEQGEQLRSA